MKRILSVLLITLTLTACMNSVHYQYADGSANVYILKPDSLEYVPVKPEESSTGMYSGGEPKKVALAPEEFRAISNLLEGAIKKTEIHIPDRVKTSGTITTFSGNEKRSVMLKPGCKEIAELEAALKKSLQL